MEKRRAHSFFASLFLPHCREVDGLLYKRGDHRRKMAKEGNNKNNSIKTVYHGIIVKNQRDVAEQNSMFGYMGSSTLPTNIEPGRSQRIYTNHITHYL